MSKRVININIDREAVSTLVDVVIVAIFIQAVIDSHGQQWVDNSWWEIAWGVVFILISASAIRNLWNKIVG